MAAHDHGFHQATTILASLKLPSSLPNFPHPVNFVPAFAHPPSQFRTCCLPQLRPQRIGSSSISIFSRNLLVRAESSDTSDAVSARGGTATRESGPPRPGFIKGSTRALSGLEEDMECIGTGTDVECVIPYTEDSVKVGSKIAARAVNSEKLASRKEISIELSSDVSADFASLDTNSDEVDSFGNQRTRFLDLQSLLEDTLESLILISPFFFWGTAMVAMKGVVPKAGPLFVAATRLIPSGFILLAFAKYKGKKEPSGFTAWLAITLFALVDASCFQGFLAEGLKRTSAGLGSVIIDSQPLTVAVLASLFFGETIGALGIVGLATGVIGLLLLEVPWQVIDDFLKGHGFHTLTNSSVLSKSISDGSGWSIWDSGEWWMLLAAQSMAVGTVMVRWVSQFSDPVMATGWHMVLGGLPLLALATIQQDPAVSGHILDLRFEDWLALAYTSVFGSAISYGVFFYNATRGSLTKLSSLTFLTPMFAALFGYLILDETLTSIQIMGAVITLASIYLVNTRTSSGNKESN